jgi:hypothetical protein
VLKKLFYLGVCLVVSFELANVWFIMPLPYSQRLESIDLAYFLYSSRWFVRLLALGLIIIGLPSVWRSKRMNRAFGLLSLVVAGGVAYVTNFVMRADRIFIAPTSLRMAAADRNVVEPTRLVVGIVVNGDVRAYPVQFIGYHHQVRDTVGGAPVLITYCTVCRTGRVFSPVVDGRVETFRLVGMDHFNAMFEDETTGSWWRQVSGEAVVGPKRGTTLAEIPSHQVALAQWLVLYPRSLVMQPDSALREKYYKDFDYETGASRKRLTGTDTVSWKEKAWVVGVTLNGKSKAYDWIRFGRERVINDEVGGVPIVLVLAPDGASFFAYARPDSATQFELRADSLIAPNSSYDLGGRGRSGKLKSVNASQEFWHSWRTFHPDTERW